MDLGHWELVPGLEMDPEAFGFVYRIDRIDPKPGDKKHYWGCKQMKSNRKLKPLKGKVKSRRKEVDSDWRTYYGSSTELHKDIEKYGKEAFKGYILRFCSCKWQLKFEELKVQMENNVLLRDDVYNGIVHVRINRIPKALLSEYVKTQLLI